MKIVKAYNVMNKEKINTCQKGKEIILQGIKPVTNDVTVIAIELNQDVR